MLLRRLIAVLVLMPAVCPAVSKEMQELMRDVALLQQQMKDMQQSQDEKFTRLQVMIQQTLDIATKANTAVAVLDSSTRAAIRDELRGVVNSSVGVGSKVDSMGGDVQALRASVEDIVGRLGKLQMQLADLSKAVQAMQAPAAPPPPAPGAPGSTPATSGPPPSVPPAEQLYNGALRDRMTGKLDLALSEFQDYLKYYGNTDYAPNAQYYIGDIHYSQNDLDAALADFDAVLEKYPDNNKTADALIMKGKTLVKKGQPTKGAAEFNEVIKRFPNSDQAVQAKAQLKALGLPYRPSPSKKKRT
jgi:tol-pal system protein YbgF